MKKILSNPWLIFSPFLLLFILLVLKLHNDRMEGDEGRYIMFANNLLQGFYSPKYELNLWNGPGYPILLLPFVALKLPLIIITLLNAFLQYLSIVFLYKTIKTYTNTKIALFFSLFWACYYISYQEMSQILTETFSLFLITLILFSINKYFSKNSQKYGTLTGFLIGFLVLTKIIFGYVLLISIFVFLILFVSISFLSIQKKNYKKIGFILCIAFFTILPYLIYTFSLTNKMFYFGNSGGMSLYWMSTPYENEYGDWNNDNFDANCGLGQPCNAALIAKNHQKNFDYFSKFKGVERDEAFKKVAIENIKKNPIKYLRNCLANQSRLWFGFPASYFYQSDRTLLRLVPNSIVLSFFIFTLFLWIINFRHIKIEINFIFLFVLLYLMASTLVSAYPRQLYIVVPVILVWGAYIHSKLIKINIKIPKTQ